MSIILGRHDGERFLNQVSWILARILAREEAVFKVKGNGSPRILLLKGDDVD